MKYTVEPGAKFAILFIIFLSFVRCYKNSEEFIPYEDINAGYALSKLADNHKNYILDISSDTSLFFSETGHILSIPKNSLTFQDGSPVSGKIKMQYNEIVDLSNLLFNGINTTYNHMPVYIKSAVYVNFMKDEEQLIINPKSKNLKWIIPSKVDDMMNNVYLYQVNEDKASELRLIDHSQHSLEYGTYSLDTGSGIHNIQCYSFQVQPRYWNLLGDVMEIQEPLVDLGCVLSSLETNQTSTSVYVLSPSIDHGNLALKFNFNEINNQFCLQSLNLDIRRDYWIFAFQVRPSGYKYHLSEIDISRKINQLIDYEFKPTNLESVKSVLKSIQ